MSITVFLADDHLVVREGMALLLNSQTDVRVIGGAGDGVETVDRVIELSPDVVIMDIHMPRLNGIEATRRIRAECPAVKVIILSMYSTTEHIARSFHAGAHGYLLKESAGSEVVAAIRSVHAGRRFLSQKISETVLDGYLEVQATGQPGGSLSSLSPREREVLQLVVEGRSSAEIAERLFLSPKTIDTYRSRLMQKLEIHDLPGLVKFAIQHGLLSLD